MDSFIENGVYRTNVNSRHARGNRMQILYVASLVLSLAALLALMLSVINQSFGLVAITFEVLPEDVADRPLDELNAEELANVILENDSRRLLVYVRDTLNGVSARRFVELPLSEALRSGTEIPDEIADITIVDTTDEQKAELLALNVSQDRLISLLNQNLLRPTVVESWLLQESLLNREGIENDVQDTYEDAVVQWRSWVDGAFITDTLSDTPALTGIWPALVGSIYLMLTTILIAFPLGVGAAIYLQEYATHNWYNNLIEINIRNLAGVPSIIYGMLGLAIFVRALGDITNQRSILSAGLTLALLILPIIIVNAQEALRAVPSTIREASYGLGATKWQTISRQVLPSAIPGIMTGTILAMSRAIGETAPLIVVGAATFLTVTPDSPLARFTALPIQIWYWTQQPDDQFRNAAAAAIIVLLVVLLTMNSFAIILRNRAQRGR